MSEQLADMLRNPRCTPAEAQEPIRLLLQLQTDGAVAVQALNPVKLFLETQVRHGALSGPCHRSQRSP